MPLLSIIFSVHQPLALAKYSSRDIGFSHQYFDEKAIIEHLNYTATNSLIPANRLLLKLIQEKKGKFNIGFSISGIMLELLQKYRPDVLQQFKRLVKTGCVEILGETYYNSACWLYSHNEFKQQVEKHSALVKDLFGITPAIFRNTELIHDNRLALFIASLGFKGMLCESVDHILKNRSRNKVYNAQNVNIGLLLRNFRLSDDIAFRFSDEQWPERPLTAEKFASWIHAHPADTECINLMFDYKTLGIYKKKETGIFDFFAALPTQVLQNPEWSFAKPSDILSLHQPTEIYDVRETISWAANGGESSIRCENAMQNKLLYKIFSLEKAVNGNANPVHAISWKLLQSYDYFNYMSDDFKKTVDALNPYSSVEEAYQNYLNIITDFELQLIKKGIADNIKTRPTQFFSTIY